MDPRFGVTLTRRGFLSLAGLAVGAWALSPKPSRASGIKLPRRGDLRLVAISDLNSSYGSTSYLPEVLRAVELIPSWKPDLVLCGGDMVAGQKPGLSATQLDVMWEGFARTVLPPPRAPCADLIRASFAPHSKGRPGQARAR